MDNCVDNQNTWYVHVLRLTNESKLLNNIVITCKELKTNIIPGFKCYQTLLREENLKETKQSSFF